MSVVMASTFQNAPPLILARQGHRLIFTFDELMSQRAMEAICHEPRFVTVARYKSKRLVVNDEGIATLYPQRDSEVWGVVWEISDFAQVGLDMYLGLPSECERFGSFARSTKGEMIASEYYGRRNNRTRGLGSPGYINKIIAAGRGHSLPEPYLNELARWRIKPAP